ncbi:hypothetical protein B0T22DRAFT_533525 [Podospora appendiculata]|uniref:BTB domain-containing protein n=1 Tax=Podospora appendiculata TaxID=314037 RepID=A0AAE0XJK9_9PEZI|nr:hypothetical protein B0T22DRAFT_533525 [Podospora appendiculata]
MATSSSNQDTTIPIAIDGDVVFVVGPSERKMRVHSTIIKGASPKLHGLMLPKLCKGQVYRANGYLNVMMADDNADAMETIVRVLHGQNDAIKSKLRPEEILEIAIASNKYLLASPLKFALTVWLDCRNVVDPETLVHLAMAAYTIRDAATFSDTTSALLFHHAGSYQDLIRPLEKRFNREPARVVTLLRIALMLAEERSKLREELMILATEVATRDYFDNNAAADGNDCQCGWLSKHCVEYIEDMIYGREHQTKTCDVGLGGHRRVVFLGQDQGVLTLSQTIDQLQQMRHPSLDNRGCYGNSCDHEKREDFPDLHRDPESDTRLRNKLSKFMDRHKGMGLCRRRVQTGEPHADHPDNMMGIRAEDLPGQDTTGDTTEDEM